MLGKLFGFRKTAKPVANTTPATKEHAIPVRPATPSLLEEMTQGQAIDSIIHVELLQQLVKNSDKLDKKTNRQVRERLHHLKELEKQQHEQHALQEKICARLETLSRLQHHPLFDSELAHLQQQWQDFPQPAQHLATRVQQAITGCQHIQQEACRQQQHLEQQQERAVREAEQQALQDIQNAEVAAQKNAIHIAEQEQKKLERQQSQAEREQHARQQREASEHIAQQLEKLESAIGNHAVKKSRDIHDAIRDALKKLDPKHAQIFEGKWHLLTGQLRNLQDWQSFAATPKLETLCADMEKLVDTVLPPLQKADAVRDLQNQWRAVKAPSDKATQILWERFRQASDKAWEPCAVYYEKEKQQRAFNLQQRQTICEALEQFYNTQDWQHADWKAVLRILEKARQEFHDFHPVERNEEKPVRTRFDEAVKAINNKVQEEQKNNEDKKRQLVDTARSVANMADIDKAIERVRQLQEQWKQIGITRRHEDQKLWEAFQEQTGLAFGKRRTQQQATQQTQQENLDRAGALCEQIAALAKLDDKALSHSGADFDQLQSEYKAITDLPEKAQSAVKKQFHAACDIYRQQLAGISRRQQQSQWQELARRAQLCALLEAQASNDHIAAVQEQWQQQPLPADWEHAIDLRRQRALTAARGEQSPDYATNEQHLRELCIELEILLDIDTPEEDRPYRREYQLRKLQQGLGQAAASNTQPLLEQLLVRWYCASPAAASKQPALQARFDAAQKKTGNLAG